MDILDAPKHITEFMYCVCLGDWLKSNPGKEPPQDIIKNIEYVSPQHVREILAAMPEKLDTFFANYTESIRNGDHNHPWAQRTLRNLDAHDSFFLSLSSATAHWERIHLGEARVDFGETEKFARQKFSECVRKLIKIGVTELTVKQALITQRREHACRNGIWFGIIKSTPPPLPSP